MSKNLQCVIDWLEAGCDPKAAAEELRAIAALAQSADPYAYLERYVAANYPSAKGNNLTERVIDALDTMDISLGMIEAAQPSQPATQEQEPQLESDEPDGPTPMMLEAHKKIAAWIRASPVQPVLAQPAETYELVAAANGFYGGRPTIRLLNPALVLPQGAALYMRTSEQPAVQIGEEQECSTHPDAPHGFDRNGSHNNRRYTCDCEGWEPAIKETT